MRNRITITLSFLVVLFLGATIFLQPRPTANTVSGVQPQLLFTNTLAAAQPSTSGKALNVTRVFDGKIFTAYGDWAADNGPIHLLSYDLANRAINDEYTLNAGYIDVMNIIRNRLYVPVVKHWGGPSIDYAWRNAGSQQWGVNTPVYTVHSLDMQTTGSDLWLIGAIGNNATANQSLDDGATWQSASALVVPPLPGDSYARFYAGGVLNGKLYVQAVSYASVSLQHYYTHSNVFDPATGRWSDGPNLGAPAKMTQFAGKLVYINAGWNLYSFDGVQTQNIGATIGGGLAPAVDVSNPGDGYYYVLAYVNRGLYVIRSADLNTWYKMSGNLGSYNLSSLDVSGNTAYLGSSDSKVYSLPLVQASTPLGSSTGTKGHK